MASKSDSKVDAMQKKLQGKSAEALLSLFADLLKEDPHLTIAPAIALRNKARADEVDEALIPLLTFALADAPNLSVFVNLAKTLAAFGRRAEMAAPMIIDRLNNTAINSDRRLWAWDGALHSLGYLGGDATRSFFDELRAQTPSAALRSKSVYRGDLSDEDREKIFQRTLRHVTDRLGDEDPRWLAKRTELQFAAPKEKSTGGLKPWMTR